MIELGFYGVFLVLIDIFPNFRCLTIKTLNNGKCKLAIDGYSDYSTYGRWIHLLQPQSNW